VSDTSKRALHTCVWHRVPAVVVTSSGTAVANLLPAVVEAAQAGVPLLLLTADRPGELRGCGANQTIDQVPESDSSVHRSSTNHGVCPF